MPDDCSGRENGLLDNPHSLPTKTNSVSLKLSDFCKCLGIRYRDARYAMAHGMVPRGVDMSPGRGNHREFDYLQAFWLAIVLVLTKASVKPRFASKMADWCLRADLTFPGHRSTNGFSLFTLDDSPGGPWYLEAGDGKFVRLVTASRKRGDDSAWTAIRGKTRCTMPPLVVVRVDLSALAQCLISSSAKDLDFEDSRYAARRRRSVARQR